MGCSNSSKAKNPLTPELACLKKKLEKEHGCKIHTPHMCRISKCHCAMKKGKEGSKDWMMTDEGCKVCAEFYFLAFDCNGDMQIDKDEFHTCCNYQMQKMGKPALERAKTDEIFDKGDANNDGVIDLEEFCAMRKMYMEHLKKQMENKLSPELCKLQKCLSKEYGVKVHDCNMQRLGELSCKAKKCKAEDPEWCMTEDGCATCGEMNFLVFDCNGDQNIDKEEFHACCQHNMKKMKEKGVDCDKCCEGGKMDRTKCDEMFDQCDTNSDGVIDLPEFLEFHNMVMNKMMGREEEEEVVPVENPDMQDQMEGNMEGDMGGDMEGNMEGGDMEPVEN